MKCPDELRRFEVALRRWQMVAAVLGLVAAPRGLAGTARAEERPAPQPPEAAPEKLALAQAVQRALARNPTVAVARGGDCARRRRWSSRRAPAGTRR